MTDTGGQRRNATLADIAAELDLHPSTVSRALDPAKAAMVKAPTRRRIVETADRLGYRPNLAAKGLKEGRTATIAVIAADLGNPWVTPIIHGLTSRMTSSGSVPVIAETGDDSSTLAALLDHMVARRVDAIVVLAARRADREIIEATSRLVPTVVAARPLEDIGVPVVRERSRLGGRLLAEHFAELGHRRVAQLRGPEEVLNFPNRAEGFSARASEMGLEEATPRLVAARPTIDEGSRLMDELLDRGPLPTAVFAHNDLLAVGAVAALRRRAQSVPDDVSVAGYNDMPLTEHLDPALTTVRFPGWQVGHEAATVALSLAAGEPRFGDVALDPEFVPRRSTAPPRE